MNIFKSIKNNYKAVLFQKIAYSFGLKVNAEIYQNIAENIEFKIIQKDFSKSISIRKFAFSERNLLEKETKINKNGKQNLII